MPLNPIMNSYFDPECRKCARLSAFLDEVKSRYPTYYCKPVPPFGDLKAKLVIVGLAPGMHGANQTGRPFTGDHAGILLYETLHKFGFATRPKSLSAEDGLQLIHCRITNAVKCLPPENKPLPAEITQCNHYLAKELESLQAGAILLALGNVAHAAILKAFGLKLGTYKFKHGARFVLPNAHILINSYHCSRYNTQTRRLTQAMFEEVFASIRNELDFAV